MVPEVYNYSLNIVPPETLFCERISFEDIPEVDGWEEKDEHEEKEEEEEV